MLTNAREILFKKLAQWASVLAPQPQVYSKGDKTSCEYPLNSFMARGWWIPWLFAPLSTECSPDTIFLPLPWSIPFPPGSSLINHIFFSLSILLAWGMLPSFLTIQAFSLQSRSYRGIPSLSLRLRVLKHKSKDWLLSAFCCVFPTLLQGIWNVHLTEWEKGQKNTRNKTGFVIISTAGYHSMLVWRAGSRYETPVTQSRWTVT